MSSFLIESGRPTDSAKLVQEWRDRIEQARTDRQRLEPEWMSNLAFAQGKHWLTWNTTTRSLEIPAGLRDRELFSVDYITERRLTALGELGSDDDRPELLLVGSGGDENAEGIQEHLNRALGWGWEYEWDGKSALAEVRRLCIDLGTAGVRARFNPLAGPPVRDPEQGQPVYAPWKDGSPVLDPDEAMRLVSEAHANGQSADLRPMNEGRIQWETLSPFNLIVPPGIPHERDFPWEVVCRPVPLETVKAIYETAEGLTEDTDISSIFGVNALSDVPNTYSAGFGESRSKLRGHVWLFTCYERPCPRYPLGRTVVFGGNELRLLYVKDKLPCKLADGTPSTGLSYFHWWRVTGRFWSRSLVAALKDPQRIINRRKTQSSEIIDRGMPKVFVEEGSLLHNPQGVPVEKVELKPGSAKPDFFGGIGPGEWMYRDIEEARVDLEHASGMRGPSMGENPESVTTYSQLALLSEKDQVKRAPMQREHQQSIGDLVEVTVGLMRDYWGDQKQLILEDEDDRLSAVAFNASTIPDLFVVRAAQGDAKPRSQGAELKKIEDIARYSTETGQPLPVEWFRDSLEAGQALELPQQPGMVHVQKAQFENHYLLSGETPPTGDVVAQDYDPPEIHVAIHREAQIQAELQGDTEAWERIVQHLDEHEQVAIMVQQQQAQIAPPPEPTEPPAGEPQAQPAPAPQTT